MIAYRIKNWNKHFEVSQSRKIEKALEWVAIPTKHDGKSFKRLIRMSNGPALFGAWVLIVQVAAKCQPRGELVDHDGPLAAADLSIKTDCPEDLFVDALAALSGKEIGWIEKFDYHPPEAPMVVNSERSGSALPLRTNERTNETDVQDETFKVDKFDSSKPTLDFSFQKASSVLTAIESRVRLSRRDGFPKRAAIAVASGMIPEHWVMDAAQGVAVANPAPSKPGGYFLTCLREFCQKNGFDFGRITAIEVPKNWPASAACQPDETLRQALEKSLKRAP